jgi:hypothetical protein
VDAAEQGVCRANWAPGWRCDPGVCVLVVGCLIGRSARRMIGWSQSVALLIQKIDFSSK